MTTSQFKDWYEILGISDTATVNDIKRAYRKMALRWHPEKNPTNRTEADRRFIDIAHAYEILTNVSRREDFDRERYLYRPSAISNSSDPRFTFRDPLTGAAYPDFVSLRRSSTAHPPISVENGASGDNPETFRDPNDVFREFFGGREPFIEAFSGVGGNSEQTRCTGIPHLFDQTLPAGFVLLDGSGGLTSPTSGIEFPPGSSLEGARSGSHRMGLNGDSEKIGNDFSGTNGGLMSPSKSSGSVRHVTTSTRIHNGRKIVTKKMLENGVETVTIEEDGKLTLKTVDGKPIDINPPMTDPLQSQPITNDVTNQTQTSVSISNGVSPVKDHVTSTESFNGRATETQPDLNDFINVQPTTSVVTNSNTLSDVTNQMLPSDERRSKEENGSTENEIIVLEKKSVELMSPHIQDPLRDLTMLRLT